MFAEFHNAIFFTSASFQLARNVYCENQMQSKSFKQIYVPFAVFIQTLHIELPIFCANYYKSEYRVMKLCIMQSLIEADILI